MAKEKSNLEKTLLELDKKFGKGSVFLGSEAEEKFRSIQRWEISSPVISYVIGGGVPKGRIIELYGPESCIDSETFISYEIRNKNGRRQNHKGGTIKRLYERFHNIKSNGKGFYQRKETTDSEFFISSINENDCVIKNKIIDVVFTGRKECFLIRTLSGKELTCTKDHKFYIGDGGFLPLEDLQVGDKVFIHNNNVNKKERKDINYKEVFVKYHPSGKKKIVTANDRKGVKKYSYIRYRVNKSVLVYEGFKNNFESVEAYVKFLNTESKEKIDALWTKPKNMDIHHIDEDFLNDDITNLKLINKSDHYRLHALKNQDNLRFKAMEDSIESITPMGIRDTYDIKCLSPYNNFIANGIVVHNSGKTSLATYFGAEIQKQGGTVAVIDVENSFDLEYAHDVLGLNTENIIFSQPESGEDALEIAESLIESGEVSYIIIDSVAALTPRAELEAEMGDQQMGLQARLMSKACRKLKSIIGSKDATVVFINQIREKIGIMFGNPETTPGGKALKFYSSIRIEVRKTDYIMQGTDNYIGIKSRLKAVKNKTAPPFRKGEFVINFENGIDPTMEYIDFAVDQGIIEKSGSWYKYNGEQLGQGKENTASTLIENEKMFEEIKEKVKATLKPKRKMVEEAPQEEPKKKTRKKNEEEPTVELNEDSSDAS